MTLQELTTNFSLDYLRLVLRQKLSGFRPETEIYDDWFLNFKDYYTNIQKIGEAELNTGDDFIVVTAESLNELSSRSSKKRQYEIAKKILKNELKDAGFFIFYDKNGNFRWSYVQAFYEGNRRKFSSFKRYTYFVSKSQTNKTFIKQLSQCDCNDPESILSAFNVEPVTKEFYAKLQRWYFWALQHARFPDGVHNENNGQQVAVIRLITRLMFIWFMKVRKLIPDELFDEQFVKDLLAEVPDDGKYYKAILQNLFFATLNTPQDKRRYRHTETFHGINKDYGNPYVFRYQKLFKDPSVIEQLFKKIPFLNGGLFECLDNKRQQQIYIDGFTDTKKYQPEVPDFLFFAPEHKEDFNPYYDTQRAEESVEGLIHLLRSYNFTIDENDPDDIEVALDPELLGSVFENLLASYNPETATTARNATGSFYTPREVVNFMTDESLKAYFKTGIETRPEIDKNLNSLFDRHQTDNPFDEKTTRQLVSLINDLRAVDPAVGSGAFPMAMLNKLVFLLGKLDPENRLWKELQIQGVRQAVSDSVLQRELIQQINKHFDEKNDDYSRKIYLIEKCIYGVDLQQIAVEIAKLRFFISLLVDETIEWDNADNYGLKPLPNLEFKLMQGNSLISRFAGKDLDELLKEKQPDLFGELDPLHQKLKVFEELKHQLYLETNPYRKKKLREQIDQVVFEIFKLILIPDSATPLKEIEEKAESFKDEANRQAYIKQEKKRLYKKLGFDLEQLQKDLTAYTEGRKAKQFFFWKLYFSEVFNEKNGFDIVIGNPPYIQLQKKMDSSQRHYADLYKDEGYITLTRRGDIYALFYEKALDILHPEGLLCYITSNKWMRAGYGKALRKLLSAFRPLKLIDMGPGVFSSATVDTNILLLQNTAPGNAPAPALNLNSGQSLNSLQAGDYLTVQPAGEAPWIIMSPVEQQIKQKIEQKGIPLKDWEIDINYGIKTGYNEAFIIDGSLKDELIARDPQSAEIIKPILRGRDIKRYYAEFADKWIIIVKYGAHKYLKDKYPEIYKYLLKYKIPLSKRGQCTNRGGKGQHHWLELDNNPTDSYLNQFEKEKIVYQELTQGSAFAYNDNGSYVANTGYLLTGNHLKFLIANLNSKFIEFVFRKFYSTSMGKNGLRWLHQYVTNIPIPKIPIEAQKPFITLVDRILDITSQEGYDPAHPPAAQKALEKEIDKLVYDLYGLTDEEIAVVEAESRKAE